jgi:purine-nucleoside phosphorylase
MSIPTPHNRALEGEIAESILLPGDALRSKFIAEHFLENPLCFNEVRGALGYTGLYRGKRVSVMSTGLGMPSTAIYVSELLKFYGVRNLIRIGTASAYRRETLEAARPSLPDREEIRLRDIILVHGACTDNGFLRKAFSGDFAPIADFEMLNSAYEKAEERKLPFHVGLIKSSDQYYHEQRFGEENWLKYGVIAEDMSTAIIYTLAAKYRASALSLLTVSEFHEGGESVSAEEREQGPEEMIRLALDTIIDLHYGESS